VLWERGAGGGSGVAIHFGLRKEVIQLEQIRKWYGGVSPGLVIRLLILPFALSALDFAVTLSFQPADYWNGDREAVLEANPLARLVLIIHPLLLVPTVIAWYLLLFPLIFKTPARIGLRIIAAHLIAHPIAISGWLLRMREDAWWWIGWLVGVVALLTVVILGRFRHQWNSAMPLGPR
jgi:hypothetical protein